MAWQGIGSHKICVEDYIYEAEALICKIVILEGPCMGIEDIKKLKILGHNYTIEHDPDMALDHDACGQLFSRHTLIKISSVHERSRQEESLFHEIIEALNYHLDLSLEHHKITQLGEGMYQVLKDNGLLKL